MSDRTSNMRRPRIAIAGATGRVGKALVQKLTGDQVDVVALTRDARQGRMPVGTAVAKIDFDAPQSLADALHGMDRLFLAHGTSDRQVADEIAIIDAAIAAGVSHIVKLSVMGPPTLLHPFDWHSEIEAHLARQEVGFAVLRPSPFADILARAGAPVAEGTWGGAAGEGLVNLIDTRDIADVARVALLDNSFAHVQRAYHLTGPDPSNMPAIAQELSKLLGQTVEYQHRSPEEHRALLVESGVTKIVADLLLGLDLLFRNSVLAETTHTVTDLTGNRARSVSGWLRDNKALFRKV